MAATTMNISLPESMKSFIDDRLENYGSASEYVRELIRADQRRVEEAKLEKLLLERLNGGTERGWSLKDAMEALEKRRRK